MSETRKLTSDERDWLYWMSDQDHYIFSDLRKSNPAMMDAAEEGFASFLSKGMSYPAAYQALKSFTTKVFEYEMARRFGATFNQN